MRHLPHEQFDEAARIYWQAFANKLALPLGEEKRGVAFFKLCFRPDQAVCILENNKLIALAGYDIGKGGLIGGGFSELWQIYRFSALWSAPILSLFARKVPEESLILDGIAVDEAQRSKGYGALLLCELEAIARAHQKTAIALDVVDHNLRAKALYERQGFTTENHDHMGLLAPILGFKSSTRMVKSIA